MQTQGTELKIGIRSMEIYTGIDQIKQLNIFTQGNHPVALAAPSIADEQVIIGLRCDLTGLHAYT